MVNIYKLKLTILQQQILRFLFIRAGTSMTARAIAQGLSVSAPAISKALPLLEKENLILVKKDKESKRLSITLNRENNDIQGLKRSDNLKQLYESGIVQFLYDNFAEATVILFGSYSLGEDTITSDIDLAVIGAKEKDLDFSEFEKKLGRKISVNHYRDFKIEKPLLNNILNGITLKGAVEL